MPIPSKYSNNDVEQLLEQVLAVLREQQAPIDLSLMTLGNAVSHLLTTQFKGAQRDAMLDSFCQALNRSVKG